MALSQTIFEIRFGYGINPGSGLSLTPEQALAALSLRDPLTNRFARPTLADRFDLRKEISAAQRDMRDGKNGSMDRLELLREKAQLWIGEDVRAYLARAAISNNGFRERLVGFWSDHFTVSGKSPQLLLAVGDFIDQAIRPNLAGSFSQMLRAVITHPGMLIYLDQYNSIGPNSAVGRRRNAGLNENLAREILELHTMGVSAGYSQNDVREFAELLTGLGIGSRGFEYFANRAEPGPKTILGKTYGTSRPRLDDIFQFLDDLSLREETARHLARKLCVHFISEDPPVGLVDEMGDIYRQSGGNLLRMYEVMLAHPASADPVGVKVKWPVEYVISSLRALDLTDLLVTSSLEDLKGAHSAMMAMGQDFFRPPGPDGWSEEAAHWITPPALAARIEWAARGAQRYAQDVDPEELAYKVLGENVSKDLLFAASEAESRWEGVALVLISPQFNKR